jgi:hypothetical protein
MYGTETARCNLVTAYRKSGLSQKIFCEQHGVKASTFKNWYYRYPESIKPEATEVVTSFCERTLDPSFLFQAITVLEDSVESPKTPTPSPPALEPASVSVSAKPACPKQTPFCAPNIQIDCSVFRIAVPIGFDLATLQGILSIMRTLP